MVLLSITHKTLKTAHLLSSGYRQPTDGYEDLCKQLRRRCSLRRREIDLHAGRFPHRSSLARHEVKRQPPIRLGQAIEGAAMDGGRVFATAYLGHANVGFAANVRCDFDTTIES